MELSSQEERDIPIPINTAFSVGHMIYHHDHHHHIPNSSNGPSIPTSLNNHHHEHSNNNNNNVPYKKVVRYRECLKNHAVTMGGNATDGCGEFMPSGEEGTIEAITCSVCNCHRNFHRKEVEGEPSSSSSWVGRNLLLGQPYHHHHKNLLGHETPLLYPTVISSRAAPTPHQMIMSYNNNNVGSMLPSESDEQEDIGGGGGGRQPYHHHQLVKKRFRTKFTQEQKEKMLSFAEKVGWKIQKQEQSVIQQFCQEIGIKRKVLKVWMHNNKHNLAKKINNNDNPTVIAPTTTTTTTTSHT